MQVQEPQLPFLSIIIPCRNEAKFIERCLASVLANDYPQECLEILVVDGLSDDGTREIVRKLAEAHAVLRLVDNPKKVVPAALNAGIRLSRGPIIVRMDAHSVYPPDYLRGCVAYLEKTGADVVGGTIATCPADESWMARTVAFVTSHPFGVGNSPFRTGAREGFVDTVPFGAFRREVFDRVGLFREELVRNQDNEMNSRIRKEGGKIYITPALNVDYFNKATLGGLLSQALTTGAWNVLTMRLNPAAFRWRHFLPFAFWGSALVLAVLSFWWRWAAFLLAAVLGGYFLAAFLSAAAIARKHGLAFLPLVFWSFFCYHVTYAVGVACGVAKFLFWGNFVPDALPRTRPSDGDR